MSNTPTEKHILLLKLNEQLNNSEEFKEVMVYQVSSEQRRWLAQTEALLKRVNNYTFGINISVMKSGNHNISDIHGVIMDACEELKLDLELDGRSDIGSAYDTGDVYRFFADLKNIVSNASSSIMIVDAYFDGVAFDNYLSNTKTNVKIDILTDKHAKEVLSYVQKHQSQFGTDIQIRSSKEIHDRIIFIDKTDCWIIGASIKDAANKKPTYLIPLSTDLAATKFDIYNRIYQAAKPVVKV